MKFDVTKRHKNGCENLRYPQISVIIIIERKMKRENNRAIERTDSIEYIVLSIYLYIEEVYKRLCL